MKKILMINGHQPYSYASGKLNKTLFEFIENYLKSENEIKKTIIKEGYRHKEEIEKFLWAEIIIIQTPIYWFSIPGEFKTYIDRTFEYGVFYKGSDNPYGENGLLKGKKYMYSLTWNSPEEAFNNKESRFFKGLTPDEVIIALHKMLQFIGLEQLKTFCAFNVIKNPQINFYLDKLKNHLDLIF